MHVSMCVGSAQTFRQVVHDAVFGSGKGVSDGPGGNVWVSV